MHGPALLIFIVAIGLLLLDRGPTDGHPILVFALALAAGFFYWLFEPNDD